MRWCGVVANPAHKGLLVSVVSVLAAATLTVGAAAASSPRPAVCTTEALPVPQGVSEIDVDAGDSTGRYLVGNSVVDRTRVPVLWVDGELTELAPPGLSDLHVSAVNNSGVVVGHGFDADDRSHLWTYADGSYTRLVSSDTDTMVPEDINDNGDIVGNVSSPDEASRPVLWPADSPDEPVELAAPSFASATGISNQGVIIGHLSPEPERRLGYVWTDPAAEGERLVGPSGGSHTEALEINGPWIAGFDRGDGSQIVGALWNVDTGEVIGQEDALYNVNSNGDATMINPATGNTDIVRPNGNVVELPGLPDQVGHGATVLFDRGNDLTAAGVSYTTELPWTPLVWSGC